MDFTKSSIMGKVVSETQDRVLLIASTEYIDDKGKGHNSDIYDDVTKFNDNVKTRIKNPSKNFSRSLSTRVELLREDIKNIKRIVITALVVSSILTFALSIGVVVGMFTEYMWLVMFCASTTLFIVGALIDKINKELFGE